MQLCFTSSWFLISCIAVHMYDVHHVPCTMPLGPLCPAVCCCISPLPRTFVLPLWNSNSFGVPLCILSCLAVCGVGDYTTCAVSVFFVMLQQFEGLCCLSCVQCMSLAAPRAHPVARAALFGAFAQENQDGGSQLWHDQYINLYWLMVFYKCVSIAEGVSIHMTCTKLLPSPTLHTY
jgi:hypothetical protein